MGVDNNLEPEGLETSPTVSIIIPTYNRSGLLPETLLSVKNQTLQEWECIIVDDGSSDITSRIVREFIVVDDRFNYYKRPEAYPKGAASCRNYGFQLSKGKYVQWLDDDDLLSDNKLELQVDTLKKYEKFTFFATCDWDLLWPGKNLEKRNLIPPKGYLDAQDFFVESRKQQTFLPIHSFLIPRELIIRAGLWNVDLSLNDDAEFLARIILHSDKILYTADCHVLYREHQENRISRQRDSRKLQSLILSFRLMHAHLKFWNVEGKAYFKMKLLKVFHHHWINDSETLKQHYFFFKENGIDLNHAKYYQLKYKLYSNIYPVYKKLFKKKLT